MQTYPQDVGRDGRPRGANDVETAFRKQVEPQGSTTIELAVRSIPRHTRPTMLDERWRQTVSRFGNSVALHDSASGTSWTFAQLAAAADSGEPPDGPLACPSGNHVGFLLTVLRAWRSGRVLCPLEPGQHPPPVPPPPSGTVLLKLTSGTSAAARCVRFTANQTAADPDTIVATMGLRPDWPNLGVISLSHSYGFASLVLPLLLHGIPLVLAPSALPAALAKAAKSLGSTPLTLPAVPALWTAWLEAGVIPPQVRLAISAGAPLPLPLEEAVFLQLGLKVHNFLGASECGGIAFDDSDAPRPDAALAGRPLVGVHVSADDAGCLVVRSPAVGTGYWPEADPRLTDGKYHGNDLVEFAPDGGLLLRGRAGDIINVAGRKLHPETLESELLRHPEVKGALVLGLPSDGARGEIVAAVVQVATGVSDSDLRDFLLSRFPAWQVPRFWHRVETLEVNTRGKISRAAWRARLLGSS